MSREHKEDESPAASLKNEASRQRWELFHRAIAHAKESNTVSMEDAESPANDSEATRPLLSIVR